MKKEFACNICLECVKKNSGCCSSYPAIPLTIKDIKRIKKLGYDTKNFIYIQRFQKNWIDYSEKWWSRSFVKHNDKIYKINMKKNKDGSCIFLKPGKGCTLGENRPYICKIYPFWVNKKGKVIYEKCEENNCLMGRRKYDVNVALRAVCENSRKIKKYHKEIKSDCLTRKSFHKKIIFENLDKI
jgi:Fe-S-cluster containining protein